MPREKGWAVAGDAGLYTGWCLTRRAAIAEHVGILYMGSTQFGGPVTEFVDCGRLSEPQARAWRVCQKRGDRAVKVTLSYT